jgi:hypothetical protein
MTSSWSRAGLDLSSPDTFTAAERDGFRAFYSDSKGEQLVGHEFLLEFRPDVLKRYYAGATEIDQNVPGGDPALRRTPRSLSFVHYYAITGWTDGLRQHLHLNRNLGVTRAEFLDVLAIAALHAGPRGMARVGAALAEPLRAYVDPEPRRHFPDHWRFDPDLLATGLDFSDPEMSSSELKAVLDWYERVQGEVPRVIKTLSDRRPRLLKAWRSRFENAIIGGLPHQMMGYCQLQLNLYRGFGEGIRSGVQMCRGLGLTVDEILDCADTCYHYGGVDILGVLDQYAGHLLSS